MPTSSHSHDEGPTELKVRRVDRPVGSLGSRWRRTWQLIKVLTPRELRIRYRHSVLDVAWALLTPLAILAVYGVVLTQSFGVTTECAPYLTSAWTGLVLWTFFATAVGGSVTSLISASDLMTKVYFPREAMPLSMTGVALADLAIGLATLIPLAMIQGVRLSPMALLSLLPIVVLFIWAAAVSLLVAVLAAFARDVVHAVQLFLRIGIFAVPVMYEASAVPTAFAWSINWNPVAVSISALRDSLLCGRTPDLVLLGTQGAIGAALLVAGVIYTRAVESRIADVI